MSSVSSKQNHSGKLSHETKLGIMLISVLVVAFGFMVYRRVDLHHNGLQSASIPSPAEGAEDATTDLPHQDPLQAATSSFPTEDTGTVAASTTEDSGVIHFSEFLSEPETAYSDSPTAATEPEEVAVFVSESTASTDPFPVFGDESAVTFEPEPLDAESTDPSPDEFPTGVDSSDFPAVDVAADSPPATSPDPFAEPPVFGDVAFSAAPVEDLQEPESTVDVFNFETGSATTASEFEDGVPPSLPGLTEAESLPATDIPLISDFGNESPPALQPLQIPPTDAQLAFSDTEADARLPQDSKTVSENEVAVAGADEFSDFPEVLPPQEDIPRVAAPAFSPRSFDNPVGPFGGAVPEQGLNRGTPARMASGSGSDGRFSVAAWNYQNSQAVPRPDPNRTYRTLKISEGESYYTIAKRVYGSPRYFSALALFNQHRIPDPRRMRAGMIILLPEAEELKEKFPQFFVDSNRRSKSPGFFLLPDGTPAYRTGEGETLSEISQRFLGRASRWVEIFELNRSVLPNPKNLRPGTVLGLPDDATEVQIIP